MSLRLRWRVSTQMYVSAVHCYHSFVCSVQTEVRCCSAAAQLCTPPAGLNWHTDTVRHYTAHAVATTGTGPPRSVCIASVTS